MNYFNLQPHNWVFLGKYSTYIDAKISLRLSAVSNNHYNHKISSSTYHE